MKPKSKNSKRAAARKSRAAASVSAVKEIPSPALMGESPAQFVRSYASHQKKGRAKASALRPRTAPPSERVVPTAPVRKAAPKAATLSPRKPPVPPPPPFRLSPDVPLVVKQAAERIALDVMLGTEKEPKLLYSKFSGKYLVASYGLALVCFIYVADTIQTRIINPVFELQGWLKSTYWVSITIMGGLTAFFLWRPTRYPPQLPITCSWERRRGLTAGGQTHPKDLCPSRGSDWEQAPDGQHHPPPPPHLPAPTREDCGFCPAQN